MSGHDNLLFITFISKIIVLSTETIVTLILSEIHTHEAQRFKVKISITLLNFV